MPATYEEIKSMVEKGYAMDDCTHIIIVCDTYDYNNYPVFVIRGRDIHAEIERIKGESMQRVDEVYSTDLSIESQMAERRAWHTD